MKTAEEWRIERWEGEDFIITGFGNTAPGTLSKREADLIMRFLFHVTPLIQLDAERSGYERGVKEASGMVVLDGNPEVAKQRILSLLNPEPKDEKFSNSDEGGKTWP